jgi:ribosomal subunit interface protein
MEPQITYRGMDHSPSLDARIQELCHKLEQFHPKITSCHVIVDERDRHKAKGNHFEVRLDVHVPGREIAVSRQQHEDPYAAVTDAFHVMERQLEQEIRKLRGEVKHHGDAPRDLSSPP